jgi:hypothetical protein
VAWSGGMELKFDVALDCPQLTILLRLLRSHLFG